jgi:hypothetical protein
MKKYIPFYFNEKDEPYPNPDWAFNMYIENGFPPELFLSGMKKVWETSSKETHILFKVAFEYEKRMKNITI